MVTHYLPVWFGWPVLWQDEGLCSQVPDAHRQLMNTGLLLCTWSSGDMFLGRGDARMNYSPNWRAVPLSTSVRNCCWRIWLQYNTIISDPSEQMNCYASMKLVSVTLFPWTRLLLSHSRVGLGDKETSGCWLRSRCMVLDPFLQWAPLRGSHVWRESTVWSPENLCVSQPTCI